MINAISFLLLRRCLVGARGGGGGDEGASTKTGDGKEMADAETTKRHNHLTTGLVIDVGATKTSVGGFALHLFNTSSTDQTRSGTGKQTFDTSTLPRRRHAALFSIRR